MQKELTANKSPFLIEWALTICGRFIFCKKRTQSSSSLLFTNSLKALLNEAGTRIIKFTFLLRKQFEHREGEIALVKDIEGIPYRMGS